MSTFSKKIFRITARNIREHRSIKEAEQLRYRPVAGTTVWYEPSYDPTQNCMYVANLFVQDVASGKKTEFKFDVQYLEHFKYKNLVELVKDTKNAFRS